MFAMCRCYVTKIGTDDVLCEVRAETERTAEDRNITNQEDRQ